MGKGKGSRNRRQVAAAEAAASDSGASSVTGDAESVSSSAPPSPVRQVPALGPVAEEPAVQQVTAATASLTIDAGSSSGAGGVSSAAGASSSVTGAPGGQFGTGLAAKQAPGTRGQAVKLRTNFFRLTLGRDTSLVHYEVSFKADKTRGKKKQEEEVKPSAGDTGGGGAAPGQADPPSTTTELKTRNLVREIFRHMVSLHSGTGQVLHKKRLVFDGRNNMYAINQRLDQDQAVLRFQCPVDGEVRTITAEYKLALADGSASGQVLDLMDRSQASVQGLDIALSYPIGLQKVQRTVRFFDPARTGDAIGMNLNLLLGFKKSVRPCADGYFVNVDRAAGLFQIGGPLPQVFANILNFLKRPGDAAFAAAAFRMDLNLKRTLEDELKNFKVKAHIKGAPFHRTYKIESFSMESVSQKKFFWEDKGKEVTVAQYYKQQYDHQLQFPNLPCIVVGKERKNYIPVELCRLMENQYYDKKMKDRIQKEVTGRTIKPPQDRFNEINGSVAELKSLIAGTLDCGIESHGTVVEGRVLAPPGILFASGEVRPELQPGRGNPCDYASGAFRLTRPVSKWAVLQVSMRPAPFHPFLQTFASRLVQEAGKRRWSLAPQFDCRAAVYSSYADLKAKMAAGKAAGMQLLLVATPGPDEVYNDVKRIGNEIALVTQCVNFNTANQRDMDPGNRYSRVNKMGGMTFVENLVKKMNSKVGGTNSVLTPAAVPTFLRQRVMLVGMDVYHPGAYSDDVQSLVGIVASYDKDFCQYLHQAMAQPQRDPDNPKRVEEIRTAVYTVLKDFFTRFRDKNDGAFPQQVIVLRDGVSEGQFLQVRNIEVKQILDAMRDCGFRAGVTFLTVQKRHSFRMFVEYAAGKVRNPLPGTVVDKSVVHADRNEYYLNSHHALKGTAKPCHYTLIHNETNMNSDMMQGISYVLCYLSGRCDKPISIPVPVNYAHLVAERAAKQLESVRRSGGQVNDVNAAIRVSEPMIDKLVYV